MGETRGLLIAERRDDFLAARPRRRVLESEGAKRRQPAEAITRPFAGAGGEAALAKERSPIGGAGTAAGVGEDQGILPAAEATRLIAQKMKVERPRRAARGFKEQGSEVERHA